MPPIAYTAAGKFRIGAVSLSTGIPVSTLRIWEARYGAFSPVKTPGKQRLFEEQDIAKARLLKLLSQNGHSISTIAPLALDDLRRMQLSGLAMPERPVQPNVSAAGVRFAVVGLQLANRLESEAFSLRMQHKLQISQSWSDLAQASASPAAQTAQVLLVKVNSLQNSVHDAVRSLVQKNRYAQTIVLYNFAPEAIVQSMKRSRLTLRREPVSDSELAELLQSVLFVDAERAQEFGTPGGVISARKYSDKTLRRMANISSNVLCECPKHVAELITQLASFEEYSSDCLNQNTQDAHLHAFLRSIAGSARSLFENALEKVAQHEGIDLREDLP